MYISQVQNQFDGLHSAWISFQQCLIDSDAMLKKHKVSVHPVLCEHTVAFFTYRRNSVPIYSAEQKSLRRRCRTL